MTDLPDDRLDALLRGIAAPQSLAARLKELTNPADDELDDLLRGVAMPEHLTLQLHAIPEDELIESELLDVHAPFTLKGEVQLASPDDRWRETTRWLAQSSVAALLFVTVSATLLTTLAAYLTSVRPPPGEPQWQVIASAPGTWEGELEKVAELIKPQLPPEETFPVATQLVSLPPVNETGLLDAVDEPFLPVSFAGPIGQSRQLVQSGRAYDDTMLLRWGLLGAPQYAEDELPELVRVALPNRSGLELPIARGYDRWFLLKEGIFPPISPAADAKLQQLEIPLTTSTASLDLAAAALAAGRLPKADDLRVEHFLAGLEARFPSAPRGQLALQVQGSPSPFGASDAWLLQLGVQTGKLRRLSKQPAHLVIAVDISASMGRGGRMEMVRHAINQAHGQLVPGDALSLIAFDEEVVCRVEHLTSTQGSELRDQLRDLLPRGGTNLAAGLQTAASVALTEPPTATSSNYRTRLVLITDSRASMPDDTTEKIREVLTLTGEQNVGFDVLDVSGRTSPDPLLESLTVKLSGSYRAISSRQQLYASLVESLAGHTPAVASEAQLRIKFNKDTVAAYRLLGHEPNLVAAVVPASVDAQLLPEEASNTLLEVWFKESSKDSLAANLGTVSLAWKDPHTGERREKKLPLQRGLFASSFGETPASFQTAAVAAEIAEQLRGSREALQRAELIKGTTRHNANAIRLAIRPWSLTLRQEPDLARLLTLVDQMEKARAAGRK